MPRHPLAEHVSSVARRLTIMDRATSTRVLWQPYDEQEVLWDLLAAGGDVEVAKPRKIGCTTAGLLWDVLEMDGSDADGNRSLCVFAIDSDEKAKSAAEQAADFAAQLGMRATRTTHDLKWPGGSRLHCTTAGGFNPGRSGTIHRLHATELPFWATPRASWQNLVSACADGAPRVLETTMDTADPFARDLWRGQTRTEDGRIVAVWPRARRHFFRVEDQQKYVADPSLITDDEWARCRDEHGFTRRDSAAWWLAVALQERCGGDEVRLVHDFPQRPEHLFATASGREVRVTPDVAPVYEQVEVRGRNGETWRFDVYGDREGREVNGQIVVEDGAPLVERRRSRLVYVAVDTRGAGKSRGTVVACDAATGRLLGAFASDQVHHDDLALIAQTAAHRFAGGEPQSRVVVLIENNGIGRATCTEASRIGLEHAEVDQSPTTSEGKSESAMCLLAAKRAIEGGHVPDGPPELAEECDDLRRDERGNLVGKKDVLMSVGMCLRRRLLDGLSSEMSPMDEAERRRQRVETHMADLAEYDAIVYGDRRVKRTPWGV